MPALTDTRARVIDQTVGADAALLIGRVCMAYIFILSGWGKLTGLAATASYLAGLGVPGQYSFALAVITSCVEFFGGVCVLLGLAARYVALLMGLFTLVAALLAHRYWTLADAAQIRAQMINFNKNIAIIGGFLALYAAGPGRWSLDHGIRPGRQGAGHPGRQSLDRPAA
jgi:putative oxidoreductase